MTRHAIFLVDSDSRRRAAIVHQLGTPGFHVEPFESVDELLEHRPRSGDLIIAYDEGAVIVKLVEELARTGNWYPIIACREDPETSQIVRAVQNGVDDYMSWPFSTDEMQSRIAKLATADAPRRHTHAREIAARARLERLTTRERQVLVRLADGHSNRSIAESLQISPRTVEIHRSNMLVKTQARHSAEAIRLAIEANLFG